MMTNHQIIAKIESDSKADGIICPISPKLHWFKAIHLSLTYKQLKREKYQMPKLKKSLVK